MDERILGHVRSFLIHHRMDDVVSALDRQCLVEGRRILVTPSLDTEGDRLRKVSTLERFMSLFDEGNHSEFLRLWAQQLPHTLRTTDRTAIRLELALRIYFAIYADHPCSKGMAQKEPELIDALKQFMETRGSEIAKSPEFLPYYALPYVEDPKSHPSFQEVFQQEFVEDLKARCERFLRLALKGERPKLYSMMEAWESSRDQVGSSYHHVLVQRLAEAEAELAELRSQRTVPVEQHVEASTSQEHHSIEFDWDLLKADLQSGSLVRQIRIVQALRWNLANLTPGNDRVVFLASLSQGDPLGLSTNSEPALSLLHNHPSVAEVVCHFLNDVASFRSGRSYLLQMDELLLALIAKLRDTVADTPMRQHILGTLQKCSLNRNAQTRMIELDVISWLVELLSQAETLSTYSIEYASALLMNLSVRRSGREACERIGGQLLEVLGALIGADSVQVKTYVNGTLFSILKQVTIKKQAKEMGLDDAIRSLKPMSDEAMGKQLDFLLAQLESTDSREDSEDDDGQLDEDGEEDEFLDDFDEEAEEKMEAGFEDELREGLAGEKVRGNALLELYSFEREEEEVDGND